MTIEIISRTSLRSFDAMRCTSKEMNKLTYDSNLVERYKQRNHIVSGLITQTTRTTSSFSKVYVKQFVPSRESKSLDLGFLGEDDRIWACSEQGIMVLERPQLLFFVCKPATKQLIQFPHPKTKYETDKVSIVVMDSKPPMRYKIVRFSRPLLDKLTNFFRISSVERDLVLVVTIGGVHIVVKSSTQVHVKRSGD
ncbi:F-box protein At5g41720-like [Bidens hawaiensis]|uniref:F-box protein At5g41720-like n=1 Tax=Bidens hawaiensis TaxID=980011 RepID=UPI00404B4446